MPRHTQFGARKNPAPSSRQHGLCLKADTASDNALVTGTPQSLEHPEMNSSMTAPQPPLHAAPTHAATGRGTAEHEHLLTVNEVAQLLQVPVSWIYARTRLRTKSRLPAYRFGKYWRFDREEVLAWVQGQCKDSRAA